MSPRRSSRARTAQPSSSGLTHDHATSSNGSSRDRNSRSIITNDGRLNSNSPAPTSSDNSDANELIEPNMRSTRLSRRGQMHEREPALHDESGALDEDDEEEEEVTRCVCRRVEYPGPPVPLKEVYISSAEPLAEDAGGLFIQCDICKVWQHGGCVGIMDEAMCPENYYCELCRSDLHKVLTGAKGQRYSRFLPVVEPHVNKSDRRLSSARRETDTKLSRETEGKPTPSRQHSQLQQQTVQLPQQQQPLQQQQQQQPQNTLDHNHQQQDRQQQQQSHGSRHQRVTNNSRAAYEEEQMLLKALEASRINSNSNNSSNTTRNMKRSRDASEDSQDSKRRKLGSLTEPHEQNAGDVGSEHESSHGSSVKPVKFNQGQNGREREVREQDRERERSRAEAAGRRKGRAERRNAEESETPEEHSKMTTTTIAVNKKDVRVSKSIATKSEAMTPSGHIRKTVRPKRARVGRNQYTKDFDGTNRNSPSTARDSDGTAQVDIVAVTLPNGSKPARPRHINPNRTSMNELRKRAAGILEFISRTQVEIAGEGLSLSVYSNFKPSLERTLASSEGHERPPYDRSTDLSMERPGQGYEEKDEASEDVPAGLGVGLDDAAFRKMSSLQMMDVLTREIVLWQKSHGKWGEKS